MTTPRFFAAARSLARPHRLALVLAVMTLFAACGFPSYEFDDSAFARVGAGGDDGSSGQGGAAHKGPGGGGTGGRSGAGGGGVSGMSGKGGADGRGGGGAGQGGVGGGSGSGGALNGPCRATADCLNGQVCSYVNPVDPTGTFCQNPNPSGQATGAFCGDSAALANDTQCVSNYCDEQSLTCAVFCSSDADCGADNTCATVPYSTDPTKPVVAPGECLTRCSSDAKCPLLGASAPQSPILCVAHVDSTQTTIVLACDRGYGGLALKRPGELANTMAGADCVTNLQLPTQVCTKACASASDCSDIGAAGAGGAGGSTITPLPTCRNQQITVTKPKSGDVTAFLKVCSP